MLGSILEFLRCAVGVATVVVGIICVIQANNELNESCKDGKNNAE